MWYLPGTGPGFSSNSSLGRVGGGVGVGQNCIMARAQALEL